MGTYAALEIGKRALLANNFGLDVTSNNIANSATEGYSRRQALTSEAAPYRKNGNYIGTGVDVQTLRSFREEYLDREVRKTNGQEALFENDVVVFNAVEVILKEPSDNNLGELVGKLLNSFEEVALQPESVGLREVLLSDAQTLVQRFNSAAADLAAMRVQAYDDIMQDAKEINQLTDQIAGYNKALVAAKVNLTPGGGGSDALTYVDHREVAIEALSKLGNVTVSYDPNGAANIFMNGINLVNQQTAHSVKVFENIDATTGESTLQLMQYDESKDLQVDIAPIGGSLASNLRHYNITFNSLAGNGYSISREIDNYANAFATNVNNLLSGGYGLADFADAAPAGRILFTSEGGDPALITASNLKLSDEIVGNPQDLPISATFGTPGNSDIARAISRLAGDGEFLAGQTPSEFYASFIGKVSNMAKESLAGKNAMKLVNSQLGTQRDSIMGVNKDEEAVNLIKFQKNFEAASRIVNMSNEILATIVNLGR